MRRNFVVMMGIPSAARFYAVYPILAVSLGVAGTCVHMIPYVALIGISDFYSSFREDLLRSQI